jgi:transposase
VLIPTTLDDAIPADHEVRVLDDILQVLDWSTWEGEYCQSRGQPPIHPRVLASLILYGQLRRIRSSRVLEYMTGHNVDFMWLTEGRTIDHTTLCKFRTRFKQQLREVFRKLGRIAMAMGVVRLGEVTFDGTRTKANNDRFETWTAAEVEKRLAELEEQFGQGLEEAERTDAGDDDRFGLTPGAVPPELADAKSRFERLKKAQEQLKAADAARRAEGIDPTRNPAQLPSTDLDSKVSPNKEGGYAPNYTPLAAVDAHSDYILYSDVMQDLAENTQTVQMVDQVTEDFGQRPISVLADGLHATGPNIVAMEQRGVDFLSPLPSSMPASNPAVREDLSQPVPKTAWPELPINPQTKRLDKGCFVFDNKLDQYHCPQGRLLKFEKTKGDVRQGQKITLRVYRCESCANCPLASRCLSEKNSGHRTITRDIYTPDRERHTAKMQTPEARKRYERRFHAGETPFGWLKHVLGLRQFLLRGLEKVRTEWLWACTAYNLRKLITIVGRLRALAAMASLAVAE